MSSGYINWTSEFIDSELQYSLFVLLKDLNQQIISFISYKQTEDFVEVQALATDLNHQGQGFMKLLIKYFVDIYSRKKMDIFLEVHAQNTFAIKLYEKCSFVIYNIRKKYYKNNGDAFLMKYLGEKSS